MSVVAAGGVKTDGADHGLVGLASTEEGGKGSAAGKVVEEGQLGRGLLEVRVGSAGIEEAVGGGKFPESGSVCAGAGLGEVFKLLGEFGLF